MSKKKYYDENGLQLRSKPKRKKHKVPIFLILILTIATVYFVVNHQNRIVDTQQNQEENKMNLVEKDNMKSDLNQEEVNNNVHQKYGYDDFKGIYTTFSGVPYQSESWGRYELTDSIYRYNDFWEEEFINEIISKKIDQDVLTIKYLYHGDPENDFKEEIKIEKFKLIYENNIKKLYSITNDYTLFAIDEPELNKFYKQIEIDYVRILMTILDGPLGLDSLAMMEDNSIIVSSSPANEPLGGWKDGPYYPEKVIHLTTPFLDEIRHNDLISNSTITFHPHGDGNITVYVLDKTGADRVSKEKIINKGTIYVNPSDPFHVVNLLGHFRFIYE